MFWKDGQVFLDITTCKKTFSESGKLKTHERIQIGDKPFECKFCKKSFSKSGNLKNHEGIHTGEKPFAWKTCKKNLQNLEIGLAAPLRSAHWKYLTFWKKPKLGLVAAPLHREIEEF